MHFEDLFKKKYSFNSVNFNKKLNWFFDIKYLNFRKLDKKNIFVALDFSFVLLR